MKIYCVCLFCLYAIFATPLGADTITLATGSSPNGKYYLTIEPSPDDADHLSGMGSLQIRNASDKKILQSFDWGQFGRIIGATSATALWRNDSHAFALTWNSSRGFTGSQVYVNSSGKWFALDLPVFPSRFGAKQHLEPRGKGQFVVTEWQPEGILKAKYEEGLVWDGKGEAPTVGDVKEDDWVYFRLEDNNGQSKLKFQRLEAVHDHGYDL